MYPRPHDRLRESVGIFFRMFAAGDENGLRLSGAAIRVTRGKYALLIDDALLRYVGYCRCMLCGRAVPQSEAVEIEGGPAWICNRCCIGASHHDGA